MLHLAISGFVVALLTAAELRWPARAEPAPRRLNLGVWLARLVLQFTAIAALLLALAAGAARLGVPALEIRRWPLVWSAPAFILAMDLAEYLYHRAQHAIPWLWARHALHHSDSCMSATTTERHWWGDLVIKALVFGAPLAALLQPSAQDYAVYGTVTLWHYAAHANLKVDFGRFSWLLNCPAYHRLHHARAPEHHGANYAALFPIFDVLAGSYRRPDGWLETGLEAQPETLRQALAWPLSGSSSRPLGTAAARPASATA